MVTLWAITSRKNRAVWQIRKIEVPPRQALLGCHSNLQRTIYKDLGIVDDRGKVAHAFPSYSPHTYKRALATIPLEHLCLVIASTVEQWLLIVEIMTR